MPRTAKALGQLLSGFSRPSQPFEASWRGRGFPSPWVGGLCCRTSQLAPTYLWGQWCLRQDR
jgi:hypothetical protein